MFQDDPKALGDWKTSSAPRITSIARNALVCWRLERDEYEAKVAERCSATGKDPDVLRVSVKNSVERQLLETCCRLKWKIKLEELDDERLVQEIDAIMNSVKNDDLQTSASCLSPSCAWICSKAT